MDCGYIWYDYSTPSASATSGSVGSRVTFECEPNSVPIDGSTEVECLDTGMWSDVGLICGITFRRRITRYFVKIIPTSVTISGRGVSAQGRGLSAQVRCLPGECLPRVSAEGVLPRRGVHQPPCEQNDRQCKNIALTQTSYAGGKKQLCRCFLLLQIVLFSFLRTGMRYTSWSIRG